MNNSYKVDFIADTMKRLMDSIEYTGSVQELFMVVQNIYDHSIILRDNQIQDLKALKSYSDRIEAIKADMVIKNTTKAI